MQRLSRFLIRRRIACLFLFFVCAGVLLTLRLAYLQIWRGSALTAKAMGQRLRPLPVVPDRGAIRDRRGEPLAMSISVAALYACPAEIDDPNATAEKLSGILRIEATSLTEKLTGNHQFVWLSRRLSAQQEDLLKEADLPGIYLTYNPRRYYPNGSLAAHVLGIAGVDNQGLEGLEFYYDNFLRGVPGKLEAERDAIGREIPEGISRYLRPEDGADLILTIDKVIQYIAERELSRAAREYNCDKGLALFMDPRSGAILAWAVYPSFDPAQYNLVSPEDRRNIAVTDQYEPGSTFKIFTSAAALEEGIVDESTRFHDPGFLEIGGIRIKCWKAGGHGHLTFVEAIKQSCNPAFATISGRLLCPVSFYRYLKAFGFGSKTGIDFPGEATGHLPHPTALNWGRTAQWATIGFGQGVAVTPLQLLVAAAAVANNGLLMRPYLMKELRGASGHPLRTGQAEVVRQVISPETAVRLQSLLRAVVKDGSGREAEVLGYDVAGKTGTAEVPLAGGRGYGEERIASFVGFAPYDSPRLIGLIVLYNPKTEVKYGGVLAAPVFRRITKPAMAHLGIPTKGLGAALANGVQRMNVPDVVGLGVGDAARLLRRSGLEVEIAGEGAQVIEQVPPPGARVAPGTKISITAGSFNMQSSATATGTSTVKVPSVVGKSMRDVVAMLTAAGLQVQVEGSGVAVSQSPAAGMQVPRGTMVLVAFKDPQF